MEPWLQQDKLGGFMTWVSSTRVARRPVEFPRPIPFLAGRDTIKNDLVQHLLNSRETSRINIIAGEPGIGKTALAVSLANAAAPGFLRGVVFVQLPPTLQLYQDVQASLLRPLQLMRQSAWRSAVSRRLDYEALLTTRKLLLVIDGADSIDHINHLFPSAPKCSVILTAARAPAGLPACNSVALSPIEEEAALSLLAYLIGTQRVHSEIESARRLVAAAEGLPFALQAVAACLSLRTGYDLREAARRMKAAELPSAQGLRGAAAYDLCFAHLSRSQRNAFLRLGLLSSGRFEPWMLAKLADDDDASWTPQAIDGLARARLIERAPDAPPGRLVYQVSEQVKAYANFRMEHEFSSNDQAAARVRLADAGAISQEAIPSRSYIYTLLDSGQLTKALDLTAEALHAVPDNPSGDRLDGASGADAYRSDNELEEVATSDGRSSFPSVPRLTALLAELHCELCLDDAESIAVQAIDGGYQQAPSAALRVLGQIEARHHRLPLAETHFDAALARARDDHDVADQIRTLRELAAARAASGQPALGIRAAREAVALSGSADRLRQYIDGALWAYGTALHADRRLDEAESTLKHAAQSAAENGHVLRVAWADYARAAVLLEDGRHSHGKDLALRAMDNFSQIRHRYGVGRCRLLLGEVLRAEGKLKEATLAFEDAMATFRTCSDRWIEAKAMCALAQALASTQRHRASEIDRLVSTACDTFRQLGDHDALRQAQAVSGPFHVIGAR